MSDAIQAAERLRKTNSYEHCATDRHREEHRRRDAAEVASAYLALVAKVRELRAAQSEDFVERLVDLYMAAGIKE